MEPFNTVSRCEVCDQERPILVSSLPGIPMSCARCADCMRADAVPLPIAVANTVVIGGMAQAADWWEDVVEATLNVAGVGRDAFDQLVADGIARMDEDLARLAAEESSDEPGPA